MSGRLAGLQRISIVLQVKKFLKKMRKTKTLNFRFFDSDSYAQTWNVAKSVCEDHGSSLVVIDNQAEKDWIATRLEIGEEKCIMESIFLFIAAWEFITQEILKKAFGGWGSGAEKPTK